MRKYFGVFTEADIDANGTWGTGLVAAMVVVAGFLLAPLVAANGAYEYGYLSPKTSNFEVPTGAVVTDIPAYQRRRRQGRGS
jgi:hypothetical protein